MGRQDDFTASGDASYRKNGAAKAKDTVNYITDLLGELHTIANVSGLNTLSEDIHELMSKHMAGPA